METPDKLGDYLLHEKRKLQQQIKQLAAEIVVLEDKHNRVRDDLDAYKRLIKVHDIDDPDRDEDDQDLRTHTFDRARERLDALAARRRRNEKPGPKPERVGKYRELGIRDAIRAVLRDSGKGLRPVQITDKLRRERYDADSNKRDLASRVGTEAWRMGRTGQLTKRGSAYRLPPDKN